MDRNKLKVLREIGYEIPKQCELCKFGLFGTTSSFGTCEKNEYSHLKHSRNERKLSIYRGGRCSKFEWNEDGLLAWLHGFADFREEFREK